MSGWWKLPAALYMGDWIPHSPAGPFPSFTHLVKRMLVAAR